MILQLLNRIAGVRLFRNAAGIQITQVPLSWSQSQPSAMVRSTAS